MIKPCRAKKRKIIRIIVKFENAQHDDPLTCFQEENASVAKRNSMKRIPGRSSRDFLATRKERSKEKKKKRKSGKRERERKRGIKLQKSKEIRGITGNEAERQREGKRRGGGRGKEREKRARSCESGTGATTKSQCWVTCIQEVNSFVAVS